MSKYRFTNGCRLPETLALYAKLMSYSGIALDMIAVDGSPYKEVIRCVFNYDGLKTGLEIDSVSGDCEVFGFLRQSEKSCVATNSTNCNTGIETICRLGSSNKNLILDYLNSKQSEAVEFRDYYQPNTSGLGGYINMAIHA